MNIFAIPDHVDEQAIRIYLSRSTKRQVLNRVGSAFMACIFAYLAVGANFIVVIAVWLLVVIATELILARAFKRYENILENPTLDARRFVTRRIFHISVGVAALYTSLAALIAIAPPPGPIFSALFVTTILMNICCNHTLHPRIIWWSLPFPAIALFFAVQQISGVAWVSAGIILFQVLVLNRHLVDTYASLTKALMDARLQSAARREADAANHAKTQFLANMSHELRTPLNAIIGYSEMMREEAQSKDRAQDISDHDKVLGSAKRLLRLINDVLDVSKIEAGKMMCDVVRFHIGDEVTAACETLRPAIEANHTTLSIDIDPQVSTATSDAFKFGQCILNLLSNATKFTNNGTIDVKVWRGTGLCADHIFVSVTDTGIGMSTDQIDTLFTPFTQADATMTRKYGGTGLGLSLSRSLARLMGGDIAVSSCLGQGSCFTLSIRPSTIGDDVYTQREDEQMARPVCADAYARAA